MAPNERVSAEKASPMMMEYERHARIGVSVHASGTRKAVRSPTADGVRLAVRGRGVVGAQPAERVERVRGERAEPDEQAHRRVERGADVGEGRDARREREHARADHRFDEAGRRRCDDGRRRGRGRRAVASATGRRRDARRAATAEAGCTRGASAALRLTMRPGAKAAAPAMYTASTTRSIVQQVVDLL